MPSRISGKQDVIPGKEKDGSACPADVCTVRVDTHWTQLGVLGSVVGGPAVVAVVLAPIVFRLPSAGLAAFAMFACMIIALGVPLVVYARRPRDDLWIDEQGVYLKRRGLLAFEELASFDASVFSHGTRGRMYLVLRPHRGSSLIIRPTPRIRSRFALACQRLADLARQRSQAGIGSPEWKSFWGSRRAKLMGAGGLALVLMVIVEAFLLDPHHVFYAVLLGIAGAPIFGGMVLGKRPLK